MVRIGENRRHHADQRPELPLMQQPRAVKFFRRKATHSFSDFESLYRFRDGLTDILHQRDGDYCIARVPSRMETVGAKVWGAGGRYPSDECGLTVL